MKLHRRAGRHLINYTSALIHFNIFNGFDFQFDFVSDFTAALVKVLISFPVVHQSGMCLVNIAQMATN